MPFVDEATASAYREAWEAWQKQLEHIHRIFLDGEKNRPDQIKGLLGREARAKTAYDAARRRLLGIDSALDEGPAGEGDNPFR